MLQKFNHPLNIKPGDWGEGKPDHRLIGGGLIDELNSVTCYFLYETWICIFILYHSLPRIEMVAYSYIFPMGTLNNYLTEYQYRYSMGYSINILQSTLLPSDKNDENDKNNLGNQYHARC